MDELEDAQKKYRYSLSSYLNQLRLNFWNELPGNIPGLEWRSKALHAYLCRARLGYGHDNEARHKYSTTQGSIGVIPYSEDPFFETEFDDDDDDDDDDHNGVVSDSESWSPTPDTVLANSQVDEGSPHTVAEIDDDWDQTSLDGVPLIETESSSAEGDCEKTAMVMLERSELADSEVLQKEARKMIEGSQDDTP
ncbi:hypothetical protein FRC02_002111 [Tulasnella sp. 418]|nr:hypothetical protein FRC02_002111 [Tulasnella sp. 418]